MLTTSSHSSGASSEKTTCIIISLEGKGKIYAKDLTPDEHMDNCIIITLEFLEEMQPHLADFSVGDLKQLIKSHLRLQNKICEKDMGAFGKGAFSKQKILKNEAIIYTGRIIKNNKSNTSDCIISVVPDGMSEDDFSLDGSLVGGLAKLFQHLPLGNRNQDTNFAMDNFNSYSRCIKFTFQHKSYLLPIITLVSKEDIEPNRILGYDYGAAYWIKLNRAFTFFTPAGEPVKRYCLRVDDPNTCNYLYLNPLITAILLTEAHINLEDGLHLIPADSFEKFKADFENAEIQDGTTIIDLQSIFELELDKYAERKTDKGKIAVIINDKEKALADDAVLKFFKISIIEYDKNYLLIPVSSLTQASTQELIMLINYLKTKVSTKCKLLQIEQPIALMPLFSLIKHSMFKSIEAIYAPVIPPIDEAVACNPRLN